MEHSWGRRIFGTVQRTSSTTKFTLVMETREGKHIHQSFYAANYDLDRYPPFYKSILDMLTLNIQKQLLQKGDQP